MTGSGKRIASLSFPVINYDTPSPRLLPLTNKGQTTFFLFAI
ncbi:MAG: hypothetical protein WBM35_03530 [Candidatus Electrothrix sp.]